MANRKSKHGNCRRQLFDLTEKINSGKAKLSKKSYQLMWKSNQMQGPFMFMQKQESILFNGEIPQLPGLATLN